MSRRRFDNTAYVEFLGYEIPSNETQTWSAIPPRPRKKCSHAFVVGNKQTLTFTVDIQNDNPFPVKLPFYDPIQAGGKYVVDSFKVNGEAYSATMDDNILKSNLPEIVKFGSIKIEFQVEAEFEVHAGQE